MCISQPGRCFTAAYEARDRVGDRTAVTCEYVVQPVLPTPAPTATPTAPPTATAAPGTAPVRITAPRRVGAGGRVRLVVVCDAACSGRVSVAADPRSAAARRLRTLGSKAFRAAAGRAAVTVRLSRRGRSALRRSGLLRAVVKVRLDGASAATTRRLTLRSRAGE